MHKVIGCINAENTCRLAHIGHAFQNATLAQPSIAREVAPYATLFDEVRHRMPYPSAPETYEGEIATVMIAPEKRSQRNRP
jgi:hypothetical protein